MVNKGFIALAGVMTVGLASAAAYLMWPVPPPPPAFDLHGTITLTSVDVEYWSGRHGEECHGKAGFRDMNAGTEVTVYDSKDTVIGTGQLGPGVWYDSCVFPFTVPAVPTTDYFQVQVSNRGKVVFSMDDAKAMRVELHLGP